MKNKRSKLEDKNKNVQDKQLKESFYNKRLLDTEQNHRAVILEVQWAIAQSAFYILCLPNFNMGSYGRV